MRKFLCIVLLWLCALPIAAQEEDVPVSAGTDFYFTVFKHNPYGENNKQTVFYQAVSTADNTKLFLHEGERKSYCSGFRTCCDIIQSQPDSVVHIHTTHPCYVSAFVKGSTAGAETAILPVHLLGTSYMLQSMPGALIERNGTPTQTYAKFSVVSTDAATTFTIQTPVNLKCVSNGQTIPAGTTARFTIEAEHALRFQPVDYRETISGVQVKSNQPVAVFQGNTLTQIPSGTDRTDYTWEQARPTTNWGREFIVPKSSLFLNNIIQVTALNDSTELYWWTNGTKMRVKTLQAGETYSRTISTGVMRTPTAEHLQTSKPACCYLYFTGSTQNNGVGDPAMVEIAPMDKPSTETQWIMTHPEDNSPYQMRLLVTCKLLNESQILLNSIPLPSYFTSVGHDVTTVITDGYITYEFPYSAHQMMRLQALEDGFSAYTMHVGKTSEASAFNISLHEMQPPPELCLDGQLIYHQESIGSYSVYNKPLSGFCPGSQLSFYTLVSFSEDEPVRVSIIDPATDAELAHYERSFDEEDPETILYNGRKWHRIGVNFTVPDGMEDITFRVENGYNAYIDSFEVRLCVPPVTIIAPDTVCIDTKNTLIAEFENDGSLVEPIAYQWFFSSDSLNWTPVAEGNTRELKLKAKPRHTGWYKVAVASSGNIDNEKCRAMSEPHKFFVIEDCPPILCPEGILLLHKEFNRNMTLCDTTITNLCSDLDLSFIINLPPNHADERLMLRLQDAATGNELSAYDTGEVPSDSLQVGTNFPIPEGVSSLRWTISNNGTGAAGQPFAIDDIEIRLCLEPISVDGVSPACRKKPHSFHAVYENYGIIETPEYQWYYSPDSAGWYNEIEGATGTTYTIPNLHKSDEGWYRVAVSGLGNMAYVNCRSISEPFHLQTQYCNTAVDQFIDTVACDTLLEYDLTWRGHSWPDVGTVIDTIRDFEDDDSVYVHLSLDTTLCCPAVLTYRIDSAVCDTMMPFLWFFNDTALLFDAPDEREILYPHTRWEKCTGAIYTLALDTFHCERLYPVIVNKYNWQLLLDNAGLRRFFPDRQYLAYQWYKDGEQIPGATEDDYAEQNELHGSFQLRIQLDAAVDNDDEYIWSNILDINDTQAPLPVTKRIYNWHGMLVGEDRMTCGVYLIRYEQGDKTWTEKKLVP